MPVIRQWFLERLYAKAVVVESEGELAAIVAVDTCIIPAEMHEIVTKRIHDYTGIEPGLVCIHSNHTHKGHRFPILLR